MPTILVAADATHVREAVETALVRPDYRVIEVKRGQDVTPAVVAQHPDVVVLDMQIGNMGAIATALDLRLEESADRAPHVPILLLLDREADKFLARRAEADALIVKPFDPGTLRRTVKRLLDAAEAAHAPPTPPPASDVEGLDEADGERHEAMADTTPEGPGPVPA